MDLDYFFFFPSQAFQVNQKTSVVAHKIEGTSSGIINEYTIFKPV